MGHRAVVVVTGRHTQEARLNETIRLYCHWCGAPEDMLPNLAAAIGLAQAILARWQDAWRELHPEVQSATAQCLADAVRAASLGMNGMNVMLDDRDRKPAVLRGPPTAEAFGSHGDLEWVYVLDADARTVHVYGGCGQARELKEHGPADPMTRLDEIRDECKADVAATIQRGLAAVRSAGWRVNPAPKRTRTRPSRERATDPHAI